MASAASKCRKCRADLPEKRPGPGRKPVYCSVGCRRAAEYELRRADAALAKVEEQIRWCLFGWAGRSKADLPVYEAERDRLEARLRELLDDDEDPAV